MIHETTMQAVRAILRPRTAKEYPRRPIALFCADGYLKVKYADSGSNYHIAAVAMPREEWSAYVAWKTYYQPDSPEYGADLWMASMNAVGPTFCQKVEVTE